MFDSQPVLKGSLVELRPLREGDYGALYAAASDPLLWEQHPQRDRWKPDVFQLTAEAYDRARIVKGGAMDHAATMRRAYELISAGDLEGFGALIADDMVEHEATPGLEPTKEGVLQFFTCTGRASPTCK